MKTGKIYYEKNRGKLQRHAGSCYRNLLEWKGKENTLWEKSLLKSYQK